MPPFTRTSFRTQRRQHRDPVPRTSSKDGMSREESRKRAGRPAQPGGPPVPDSVHRLPGWLAAVLVVGVVECGAGAVERAGYEVAVDLVGDLDAAVAEPAGHLGDRGAFGQGGGGVELAQ